MDTVEMELLTVIRRQPDLPDTGRISERTAVRAIIRQEQRLLMVYSPVNGDYKFPGGGVNPGETQEAALAREVLEECGARLTRIEGAFGRVIEYDRPEDALHYDLFRMTSFYYRCQVDPVLSSTNLDDYEAELAFQGIWVDIDEAIHTNQEVLRSTDRQPPFWTRRDTFILNMLREVH